jgi:hypothetical protein
VVLELSFSRCCDSHFISAQRGKQECEGEEGRDERTHLGLDTNPLQVNAVGSSVGGEGTGPLLTSLAAACSDPPTSPVSLLCVLGGVVVEEERGEAVLVGVPGLLVGSAELELDEQEVTRRGISVAVNLEPKTEEMLSSMRALLWVASTL